jgi:Tfp pilus assembly protein PilV
MTLRTGKTNSGFSLIELMLTVSFVMLGAILLQGSYMRSAEIFGRYTHSLEGMVWAQEQISQAREALLMSDEYTPSDSGTIQSGGKSIDWSRETRSASGTNLHSINMKLSWKEGSKVVDMEAEQYVYKNPISSTL